MKNIKRRAASLIALFVGVIALGVYFIAGPVGASIQTVKAVGTFTPMAANPLTSPNGTNETGKSSWRQRGTNLKLRFNAVGLTPGQSYYTVVYGNNNCDPAQAFPVGYFTANTKGAAHFEVTLQAPSGLLAGTMSISTRRADADSMGNPTDVDMDGKTGVTDVVAVPGQPGVGLEECDVAPVVTSS